MKKRLVDLRSERPILDLVSYGRAHRPLTPAQRMHVQLTVHRIPEVMVKVSGGARSLAGVQRHMRYVGRDGTLGMETDTGEHLDGKKFEKALTEDWNLEIEAHELQTERAILGRRIPKLVHNVIFSMPPGTPPKKVLQAVRKLARDEWQDRHRYAMTLHQDDMHPHVHVVLKAVGEDGSRLNIRKATLRSWRSQFAANLRELGVAANATERAVRGQTQKPKKDGIYRAERRGQSHHINERQKEAANNLATGSIAPETSAQKVAHTRMQVLEGWALIAARLRKDGDHKLASHVDRFASSLPPPLTERAWREEQARRADRSRNTELREQFPE
jgi:hypothetical protein